MGIFWPSSMDLCLLFLLKALAKAEDQFKRIMSEYPEESCFCLAHYGIGRVYLRQNRLVWWGKKKSFYLRNCVWEGGFNFSVLIIKFISQEDLMQWIWYNGFNKWILYEWKFVLADGSCWVEQIWGSIWDLFQINPKYLGVRGELRGKEQILFVLRGEKLPKEIWIYPWGAGEWPWPGIKLQGVTNSLEQINPGYFPELAHPRGTGKETKTESKKKLELLQPMQGFLGEFWESSSGRDFWDIPGALWDSNPPLKAPHAAGILLLCGKREEKFHGKAPKWK